MSGPIPKVGERFGELTVESLEGRRGTSRLWLCRCDCGGVSLRTSRDLNVSRRIGKELACRECAAELRRSIADTYRLEAWRRLWATTGSLYSQGTLEVMAHEVGEALIDSFGPVVEVESPEDFTIASDQWGRTTAHEGTGYTPEPNPTAARARALELDKAARAELAEYAERVERDRKRRILAELAEKRRNAAEAQRKKKAYAALAAERAKDRSVQEMAQRLDELRYWTDLVGGVPSVPPKHWNYFDRRDRHLHGPMARKLLQQTKREIAELKGTDT